MDFSALQYTNRSLAAGLLYLIINKEFYESNYALLEHLQNTPGGIFDELALFFGQAEGCPEDTGGFETV
jgi:hypothetical protein